MTWKKAKAGETVSGNCAFRRAVETDLPDIMRLIHEAQAFIATQGIDQWQDGYPDEDTLRRDIVLDQLYLIVDGNAAAAVAALSLAPEPAYDAIEGAWHSAGKYMTIHRMALDDAHRGGGLAAEVLKQAERLARAAGCESLRIDTHRGNRAMGRFLEKSGFAWCGVVYYYVKKGDPERVAFDKLL